jgi:hypothetical protein
MSTITGKVKVNCNFFGTGYLYLGFTKAGSQPVIRQPFFNCNAMKIAGEGWAIVHLILRFTVFSAPGTFSYYSNALARGFFYIRLQ